LAAATSASDNDTDERRWVLQFAAEGKRIELAAGDEKTVQQWADAIASACDDLRTRASTDSSMASSHPRFDMGSDGSLSMSSKLRLHHAAEDAAAATSGDDGSDGRAATEPRVLREGWLHRKGETIMFGSAYKKKWAVLDTMLLRFYDSEKDARKSGAVPVATIALAFASVKVAADKKSGESKYHFDLYSGQKRHELYAETEVSRNEWTEAIQSVASALITAAAAGGDKRDPVFGVPLALVMDGQRDTHGSLAIPYACIGCCRRSSRTTAPRPSAFSASSPTRRRWRSIGWRLRSTASRRSRPTRTSPRRCSRRTSPSCRRRC
jgi:hypothetical protein